MAALDDRLAPLRLATLTVLVGLQPLVALLAEQTEFLAARDWSPTEARFAIWGLVGLVAAVPILVRGTLRCIERAASLPEERLCIPFDVFVVAVLATVWALEVQGRLGLDALGGPVVSATAVVLGGLAGWLYRREEAVRIFVAFLSPALIAVPLLFSLDPRVARLGQEEVRPATPDPGLRSPAPIVIVVFDALSTTALVDGDGRILPGRYPRLAELAEDATWFPDATTMAAWTTEAVPAILTGKLPREGALPTLRDHPHNLFTYLAHSHRLVAAEGTVLLCPDELDRFETGTHDEEPGLPDLLTDLALVRLHQILPPQARRRLPRIDQSWGEFLDSGQRVTGELERFESFLRFLETDRPLADRPTLYYLHVVFPHLPHRHLPSGKVFRDRVEKHLEPTLPGTRRQGGRRIRIVQRYLLQTGFVDRMVGWLTDALRRNGLYERSFVVVTADHGARLTGVGWPEAILHVPLLVKEPGTGAGRIEPRAVATLDLLPSLLERLDASRMPPEMKGRSFFTEEYRPDLRFYRQGEVRILDLPEVRTRKHEQIGWFLDVFGDGSDPEAIFRASDVRPELVGRRLDAVPFRPVRGVRIELDRGFEANYDPNGTFAPVQVLGSIALEPPIEPAWIAEAAAGGTLEVAIALDGRIESTVPVEPHRSSSSFRFETILPESRLQPGPNRFAVVLVGPRGELLLPSGGPRAGAAASR